MEGHHHQYSSGLHIDTGGSRGSGGGGVGAGDNLTHWSIQETRDFLMIRAELDPSFMEIKRNKILWEIIAIKMREKGYNRSPNQCKWKWKNLTIRYKIEQKTYILTQKQRVLKQKQRRFKNFILNRNRKAL
ncbi:hypothetical protein M9H77_29217 [Catharanthus roseus]|uniref:Uncharacterized protein n=1 Tax=Catharanthus roseus TaxID=4058 RepID=A0ACC0AIH8_CATRO|nr:hypothetical protein M9H77_29217 [Catharanthus roseus]